MPADWKLAAEKSKKIFQQECFKEWLDAVGSGDRMMVDLWEGLLKLSKSPFCSECTVPIDPDESYCILCRDREKERRKRYVKACKKKWTCVVLLHNELKSLCGHFPLDKDHLTARLRTMVGKLQKGRRTEISIWSEFKEIIELLGDDIDHSGRRKLLEECCPSDEEESERKKRRDRIEDLHRLLEQVSVLGKIIGDELQRCREPRGSKIFCSSRARYLQDLVTRNFTLDPHRGPIFS